MVARLLLGDAPLLDQLGHEGVVAREALEHAVVQKIGA